MNNSVYILFIYDPNNCFYIKTSLGKGVDSSGEYMYDELTGKRIPKWYVEGSSYQLLDKEPLMYKEVSDDIKRYL
jgi:hypothetical protein